MVNFWVRLFKPKMYKASWILSILFLVLMVVDVYSTLKIRGDYLEFLEMNPLFPLIGVGGIIALNFFVLYIFILAFKNSNPFGRFMAIGALVIVNVLRIVVVINNFAVGEMIDNGEIVIEDLKPVSMEQRFAHYSNTITYALAGWMVYLIIIYGLFKLDNRITRKDG